MPSHAQIIVLYVKYHIICNIIFTTLCISVSFYGESYIHIPYNEDLSETNLELRFKASRPYGVLVLVLGSYDYFLLQLHAGTIQLKVNMSKNMFFFSGVVSIIH